MSYYCTDELDNLTQTNGVLKSEDVAPEVHKFSEKAQTYRLSYISNMQQSGDRVLSIKFKMVDLALKDHLANEQRKANSNSALTKQITKLFDLYEVTMTSLNSRNIKKVNGWYK